MATSDESQGESTYPIDAESPAETERLLDLHVLSTESQGGILPEIKDFAHIHTMLDIACGPGGWVLQAAQEHPTVEVIGIDASVQLVDYARAQAKARGLHNARFQNMDALQPLDFADNSFDLVNSRALVAFMYPQAWTTLLKEMYRICRPGGAIRMTEGEMPLTNSPAFERLSSLYVQALKVVGRSLSPDGRHFGITPMLPRLIKDAGFQHVEKRPLLADFSTGSKGHAGWSQEFTTAFQLGSQFLLHLGLIQQEEFNLLYQQMLAEMSADTFCGIAYGLTVWGEK